MMKYSVRVLSLIVVTVGCAPEETVQPSLPGEKTEIITAAPWKVASYLTRNTLVEDWQEFPDSVRHLTANPSVCYPDDVYAFKLDGTVVRDNGTIRCMPAETLTDSGTWLLDDDESELVLNFFGIGLRWSIAKVSQDTLQIEMTNSDRYLQMVLVP